MPSGPVVKVCGLTRAEDVVAARDLGVWALGFVFAPSPRRVEADHVRRLIEGAGLARPGVGRDDRRADTVTADGGVSDGGDPLTVGVFTEQTAEEIASVVTEAGLGAVQLHGLPGPDIAAVVEALGGEECSTLIIKAVPVSTEETDPDALRRIIVVAGVDADVVLLDTKVSADGVEGGTQGTTTFGGSGSVFPWELVREARHCLTQVPVLVAGGIGPDNVLAALEESGAWGVDVSSGVESSPGVKDEQAMGRLVALVRGERAE